MTVLNMTSFVLLMIGSYLLLGISLPGMASEIAHVLMNQKMTLRKQVEMARGRYQRKGLSRLMDETQNLLRNTGKEKQFMTVCFISLLMAAGGASIGLVTANLLLVPILGYGMALMPFWYVMLTANGYRRHVNEELETALSIITTSYLRSENLLLAIEENLTYLNSPVQEVFAGFMTQTRLINANIRTALERLKGNIDNDVFKEWCDAMMACSENRNLKSTLLPIVGKLSDMRVVGAELEYMMYAPMKEFITMAILLLSSIPLMFFLNRTWFENLTQTIPGKSVLSCIAVVLLFSLSAVVKLSKPVEYRR